MESPDMILTVTTGKHRFAKRWTSETLTWKKLVHRLATPKKTQETMQEYIKMPLAGQSDVKDIGGFVGGTFRGESRKIAEIETRTLLTLDADFADDSLFAMFDLLMGCAALKYSTHKDRIGGQRRIRIIAPYSRPVTPDEHEAISRKVAEMVGMDYFDDSTYQASRLMYWPSISCDQDYDFEVVDGDPLNVDEVLNEYGPGEAWKDASNWPYSSRATQSRVRSASHQGDPLLKKGIVGEFCRAYSIEEAIASFLPDKYIPTAKEDRWTYAEGTSAAGLVLYEGGKFAYSNHATDPISGLLVNAFDLVRMHKFYSMDDGVNTEHGAGRMPSFRAMRDLALSDKKVKSAILTERVNSAQEDFGEEPLEEEDANFLSSLTLDKQGRIENTADNILTILNNDPKLRGAVKLDTFQQQMVVIKKLPWRTPDYSRGWTDTDSSCLRNYLARIYGVKTRFELQDALAETAFKARFHPVRDYLNATTWDGTERAENLFIKYLGAEDTAYTKAVTRCTLTAAVMRVFQPGCKFDEMPVLVGAQGIGKTLILSRLGGEWFSNSFKDVESKDSWQAMNGRWIIEMGELRAQKRSDEDAMKNFLSKTHDIYRPAFGREVQKLPRQNIFIGTVNDDEFLRDVTGNRRYWPVTCKGGGADINALTPEVVAQIWAEVRIWYTFDESIRLTREMEVEADKKREMYTSGSDIRSMIEEHMAIPVPKNWDKMQVDERLNFLRDDFENEDKEDQLIMGELVMRSSTCVMEIVKEMFDGDLKMRSTVAAALKTLKSFEGGHKGTFGMGLGRQRSFIRKVAAV